MVINDNINIVKWGIFPCFVWALFLPPHSPIPYTFDRSVNSNIFSSFRLQEYAGNLSLTGGRGNELVIPDWETFYILNKKVIY